MIGDDTRDTQTLLSSIDCNQDDNLMRIIQLLDKYKLSPASVQDVLAAIGVGRRETAFTLARLVRMSLVRATPLACTINRDVLQHSMPNFEEDSDHDSEPDCLFDTYEAMKDMSRITKSSIPTEVIVKHVADRHSHSRDHITESLDIWVRLKIVRANDLGFYVLV